MNSRETIEALATIKTAFTRFNEGADSKRTLMLWERNFKDDDYQLVMNAVDMYISSSKFPPTIADIREKMVDATVKAISAADAWGQVQSAISKYGFYRPEEGVESMDTPVAQLVKRLGFKELCMSENQMADRAHFIKLWDNQVKHSKEQAMLPEGIKKALEFNWQKNDMNKAIGNGRERQLNQWD